MFEEAAKKLIISGSVGVIPTDTVYGIVARAEDKEAVNRLYSLKKRENKPGTLIAASIDQIVELGFKKRYLTAVAQYWPGRISIIIPCGNELKYLHLGKFGIAIRLPAYLDLIKLLKKTGPLLTTSANLPGEKPANNIAEAKKYFSNSVDFYIDGGDTSHREPSTVIRIVDDAIEVLRPGAVKINEAGRIDDI